MSIVLGTRVLQENQRPYLQLGNGLAPDCIHLYPQPLDNSPSAHTLPDLGPRVGVETWRTHSPLPYLENWIFFRVFIEVTGRQVVTAVQTCHAGTSSTVEPEDKKGLLTMVLFWSWGMYLACL